MARGGGNPRPAQARGWVRRHTIRPIAIEPRQRQRRIHVAASRGRGQKRHGGAGIGDAQRGIGPARDTVTGQVGLAKIELGEMIALVGGGPEQADHFGAVARHAATQPIHEGQRRHAGGIAQIGRGPVGRNGPVDIGTQPADAEIVVIAQTGLGRTDPGGGGTVIERAGLGMLTARLCHGRHVEQRAARVRGQRHRLLAGGKARAETVETGGLGSGADRNLGGGGPDRFHAGGTRGLGGGAGCARGLAFGGKPGDLGGNDRTARVEFGLGAGLGLGLGGATGLGGGSGFGRKARGLALGGQTGDLGGNDRAARVEFGLGAGLGLGLGGATGLGGGGGFGGKARGLALGGQTGDLGGDNRAAGLGLRLCFGHGGGLRGGSLCRDGGGIAGGRHRAGRGRGRACHSRCGQTISRCSHSLGRHRQARQQGQRADQAKRAGKTGRRQKRHGQIILEPKRVEDQGPWQRLARPDPACRASIAPGAGRNHWRCAPRWCRVCALKTQGKPTEHALTHPSPTTQDAPCAGTDAGRVLVADLDGTLLRSDMLHESFWDSVARDPRALPASLVALRQGKPALKACLAGRARVQPATLPYDARVIARLQDWRAGGGRTALVTATDARLARAIGDHLGLFDEVHGTRPGHNLKGAAKARFLVDRYGAGGFDYMGDSAADLPVWAQAHGAISVNATPATRAQLDRQSGGMAEHLLPGQGKRAATWRALRPHQWVKNVLVFVPMIADLAFDLATLLAAMLAFVALSLAASAGYVLNDLLDLADDRSHPRKRHRPFASGALSAATGTWMFPALLVAGLAVAALVGPLLLAVVALYFVATMAYSIKLKRHTMIDICMLATLFTLRIVAGGVAIGVPLSVWLLAVSMFLFFALAAVKRLAELTDLQAAGRSVTRRGYRVEDRSVLSQMAVSSGYLAVLVLALYIDEPVVQEKFGAPWMLWAVCPLLIFWISRMVMVAARGEMHDDPLIWALETRTSRKVMMVIAVFIVLAVVV